MSVVLTGITAGFFLMAWLGDGAMVNHAQLESAVDVALAALVGFIIGFEGAFKAE